MVEAGSVNASSAESLRLLFNQDSASHTTLLVQAGSILSLLGV